MKIKVTNKQIWTSNADLSLLPLIGKPKGKSTSKDFSASLDAPSKTELGNLEKQMSQKIAGRLNSLEFKPSSGSRTTLTLIAKKQLINFRFSGIKNVADRDAWRKLAGDAVSEAKRLKAKNITISLQSLNGKETKLAVAAIIEGLILGSYSFLNYKSAKPKTNLSEVTLLCGIKITEQEIAFSKTLAEATCFTRDLVNTPASDMTPSDLVTHARKIAKKRSARISFKSFNRSALKKLGANALLAVAAGSAAEPYLIHLTYKPAKKSRKQKTIALVGKGVTFDSGGLSIKPGPGMYDMKMDMAGAGCMLGVAKALSEMPTKYLPEQTIHFLIPTCENMINENSVKPGDVVRAINKKSIEILNTDAEGRLILADALSYSKRLNPDVIIDAATLTGACIAALGSDYSGLFSKDKKLTEQIIEAGKEAGENFWPLPLAEEYKELINSDIADIKNIGSGGPGATTAALFLEHFVPENVSWAHLDIAGPAHITKGNEYRSKGGTGVGVRTLINWLGL
jgi:leucyl aminopeptidase